MKKTNKPFIFGGCAYFMLFLVITLLVLMCSCDPCRGRGGYPSKGTADWAKGQVLESKRVLGDRWKIVFITDSGDYDTVYSFKSLEIGQCYMYIKPKS